jgi:hypothetical protein
MHPDCLICLEKVKENWSPPTKCECEIIIHEKCWTQWEKRAGPRCIICRKGIRALLVPQEQEAQAPQAQERGGPLLKAAAAMIIFFLTLLIMVIISQKPLASTDRNWRRLQYDEL